MDIKKILKEEESNQKKIELDNQEKDREHKKHLKNITEQMQSGVDKIFENIKIKVYNIKAQLQDYTVEIITPSKITDDTHISWHLIILDQSGEKKYNERLKISFYITNLDKQKYYFRIDELHLIGLSDQLLSIYKDIKHLEKKEFNDFDKLFLEFINSSKENFVKLKKN